MNTLRDDMSKRAMDPQELIKKAEQEAKDALDAKTAAEREAALEGTPGFVDANESLSKQAESVLDDIGKYLKGELKLIPEGVEPEPPKTAEPVEDPKEKEDPEKSAEPEGAEKSAGDGEPEGKKKETETEKQAEDNEGSTSAVAALIRNGMQSDALKDETVKTAMEEEPEDLYLTPEKVASLDIDKLKTAAEKLANPAFKKMLAVGAGSGLMGMGIGASLTNKRMGKRLNNYLVADEAQDRQELEMAYRAGQQAVISRLQSRMGGGGV